MRPTDKDRRLANVQRTIKAIEAMGLQCDRTSKWPQEYRITYRHQNMAISEYATTDEQALAIAKRMAKQWIKP